jgi:Amt family ammonium transporter
MRHGFKALIGIGLAGMAASPAAAQLTVAPDSGDTGWVLAAATLALIAIIAGLALRNAGIAQARAALAAAVLPLGVLAAVPLLWVIAGYSLAFGSGSAWIGGVDRLFLSNLADIRDGTTIAEAAFAWAQIVSAIVAPALIVSALVGRARAGWSIALALVWSLIVYVPLARWVWSGWLTGLGTLDYAGGIVIHLAAGVSALTAAWMIGPRHGVRSKGVPAPGSPLSVLAGSGLAWAGWVALAGASALAATDDAARAIVNVQLAAGAGALAWMAADAIRRTAEPHRFMNGALAAIAATATVAGYAGPAGAILLGIAAALLARLAAGLIGRTNIDDSSQIAAIHGTGGLVGALLLPIAMLSFLGAPLFEDAAPFAQQVVAQLVAVAVTMLWAVVGTLISGYMISMLLPMRGGAEDVAAD